jgi:hypothetical protein
VFKDLSSSEAVIGINEQHMLDEFLFQEKMQSEIRDI